MPFLRCIKISRLMVQSGGSDLGLEITGIQVFSTLLCKGFFLFDLASLELMSSLDDMKFFHLVAVGGFSPFALGVMFPDLRIWPRMGLNQFSLLSGQACLTKFLIAEFSTNVHSIRICSSDSVASSQLLYSHIS